MSLYSSDDRDLYQRMGEIERMSSPEGVVAALLLIVEELHELVRLIDAGKCQ